MIPIASSKLNSVFYLSFMTLILSILIVPCIASAAVTVKVDPPSVSITNGDSVTLSIMVEGVQNLGSFQFDCSFSSSVLSCTNAALGNFLGSSGRTVAPVGPTFEDGKVTIGGFTFGTSDGPSGTGALATLTFETHNNGTSALELSNILLTDVDGININVDNIINGTITVEATETITEPENITAPETGKVNQELTITAGVATSSMGHAVEYQFDWGNGTQSSWGDRSQVYHYLNDGTMNVKARARCIAHPTIISEWSTEKSIVITYCTLSISITPPTAGSVSKSPDKINYSYNDNVQLNAVAYSGYKFINWSGDLQETTNPATINMDGDKAITALFEKDEADDTSHFSYITTDDSYSIIIQNALLDNQPLEQGDEIGVFTPAGMCVGASRWTGEVPLALIAWRDDVQTEDIVDGYISGEEMHFRIWDRSDGTSKDYPATALYGQGNGHFDYGPYALISRLTALKTVTQKVMLYEKWSWISFNVNPLETALEDVFANVKNLNIIINGKGKFYVPGVINGIGNINVLDGYKIYMSAQDSVDVVGDMVSFDTPISLTSGWNFISYLPTEDVPVEVALNSVINDLDIIKQDDGNFFVPDLINTIGKMTPGKGYKVHMAADNELIYNINMSIAKSTPKIQQKYSKYFEHLTNTGDYYGVVVDKILVNDELAKSNLNIGIFASNDLCVGSSVWNGNGPIGLAGWADDSLTETIEGYQPNELMAFKIYDPETDKMYPAKAQYRFGNHQFDMQSFSLVSLRVNTNTGFDDEYSEYLADGFTLFQNYPNPFNPQTTISFKIPKDRNVFCAVYNLRGELVETLINGKIEPGTHNVNWNAAHLPTGIYVAKLTTGEYMRSIKMLLIR